MSEVNKKPEIEWRSLGDTGIVDRVTALQKKTAEVQAEFVKKAEKEVKALITILQHYGKGHFDG